jgi:GH24 family phage-related lysozyme (muramidase)
MNVTNEGLDLIKHFEGLRTTAYRDAVGVWTIGYGHTSMAGAPQVQPNMQITEAEAHTILARDVEMFAKGVAALLQRPLSPSAFSALVSFSYNVGLGAFKSSSVLRAVNSGDVAAVPRRLQLWNKAGGRVLPGLVRRRAAEAALFVSEHSAPNNQPVEPPVAKPMHTSRTLWASFAAFLLALLQAWLAASLKLAGAVVLVLLMAALVLVIYERIRKMKEEGL